MARQIISRLALPIFTGATIGFVAGTFLTTLCSLLIGKPPASSALLMILGLPTFLGAMINAERALDL